MYYPEEKTTRQMILDAAREEFTEKGYKKAALRNISQRAGVTTGALYGYFTNKQDLFGELVGESYRTLLDMYRESLSDFAAMPPEEQYRSMLPYTTTGMQRMTEYIYSHRRDFKLILCSSDGTEYDHLIHEMAQLDVEAAHNFRKSTGQSGVVLRQVNPTLEHMLISGMFSTFFELIIHDIPREEGEEYISQMMEFYTAGWQKIMGF